MVGFRIRQFAMSIFLRHDGLSSHRVALNGKLLKPNTKTGTLPVLQAISVRFKASRATAITGI